ncbi:hypothetical protein HY212_04825 [Candidatus Pacearchaeota archaeon]|nr:hypothetical protein [Candidatus Pacearchaeota archaeon]
MNLVDYLKRYQLATQEDPIHSKLLDDISSNPKRIGLPSEVLWFREVSLIDFRNHHTEFGRVDLVALSSVWSYI